MEDRFGRRIDYLRISVTDRCNLRCLYCMPAAGIRVKPRAEILRFEEIIRIAQVALRLGINRFRLTGGEPLIRRGILSFIRALALLPGVKDLSLTTNGTLLSQMKERLFEAGIRRLNISLDTLNAENYRRLTRGGDFHLVWEGITGALRTGFHPVKINVVALRGFNDREWPDFARLTYAYPLHVRFIEIMPVGTSRDLAGRHFISCSQIKSALQEIFGDLAPAGEISGSGPARYFRLPGALGTVGFIDAVSNHFCARCNRLRLTADGKLRPCLHDHREVDLRGPLRAGAGDAELEEIFRTALLLKPEGYHEAKGAPEGGRGMCQIGG